MRSILTRFNLKARRTTKGAGWGTFALKLCARFGGRGWEPQSHRGHRDAQRMGRGWVGFCGCGCLESAHEACFWPLPRWLEACLLCVHRPIASARFSHRSQGKSVLSTGGPTIGLSFGALCARMLPFLFMRGEPALTLRVLLWVLRCVATPLNVEQSDSFIWFRVGDVCVEIVRTCRWERLGTTESQRTPRRTEDGEGLGGVLWMRLS